MIWIWMMLFYTMNATSQLVRDDDITPWRGPRENHPLFFQVLIDVFSKSNSIDAYLIVVTCINHFFLYNYFLYVLFTN